jgi:cellulose synthase/poly-beta-1,6-N-acetylglucosamine synthase-like glycosyltransferase
MMTAQDVARGRAGQGSISIMNVMQLAVVIVYFAMLAGLCCYGLHRYWMLCLFYRHRGRVPPPPARFDRLPRVTVQLPLYNEMYVAERLLAAVAALDYPREKLEIQVLDDSTDETVEIVARNVAALRARGFDARHLRRRDRDGYKAGALRHGLESASGEFIAIFDADFVPPPDLLQRTIHQFTDPGIGMLQTRWGHLNERFSLLTRVQAMLLDGHFLIEHTARSRSGRFFNFNGTAGIWRRRCIEQAGGWQADTLAEDLDLSYRAQMRGWRFVFLPEVITPAELPLDMNAFKAQQYRWAKGSAQTCRKLLPRLWRSRLPLKIKLEAAIHLSCNLGYVMLLVLCLTFYAAVSAGARSLGWDNAWMKLLVLDAPILLATSVSVASFYMCAQMQLRRPFWRQLLCLPLLMAVGVGLCLNNARAVLEGWLNHPSEFVRTPKYGVVGRAVLRRRNRYRVWHGTAVYLELGLALYFSCLFIRAMAADQWAVLPFVAVFQAGFAYVGLMSLLQSSGRNVVAAGRAELLPSRA